MRETLTNPIVIGPRKQAILDAEKAAKKSSKKKGAATDDSTVGTSERACEG